MVIQLRRTGGEWWIEHDTSSQLSTWGRRYLQPVSLLLAHSLCHFSKLPLYINAAKSHSNGGQFLPWLYLFIDFPPVSPSSAPTKKKVALLDELHRETVEATVVTYGATLSVMEQPCWNIRGEKMSETMVLHSLHHVGGWKPGCRINVSCKVMFCLIRLAWVTILNQG